MKTSEILECALGRLETRGWAQGTSETDKGQLCAMEAIFQAIVITDLTSDQMLAALVHEGTAYEFVAQAAGINLQAKPLWSWNDDEKRTQTEVLDTFRNAAKLARESEELNETK